MTGEGIFTFYSEDAKRILAKYEDLCCREGRGEQGDTDGRKAQPLKESSLTKSKKNPLSFLFKRESSFCSLDAKATTKEVRIRTRMNSY